MVQSISKLGFELIMPYKIHIAGLEKKVFAFVPGYGSPNGTLILTRLHMKQTLTSSNGQKQNKYFAVL
jgi:hypothetical protein